MKTDEEDDSAPVCAYGTPSPCGPCAKCEAANDRDVADMARDRFFGVYDREGYTPNERTAMKRRPPGDLSSLDLVRALQALNTRKRGKYGNIQTEAQGFTFASKLEAKAYGDLHLRQLAGEISDLDRQVSFDLAVNGQLICRYIADFVYHEAGRRIVSDAKGKATAEYKIKKKLMAAIHGIAILEV